jgi:RNA polymerase sigma-70 factor (ECF subfamily)
MEADDRSELQRDLTRLAAGERDAFAPVFTRLWPELRALAGRYLPAADAEDAAQLALMKLFARAQEFDPERDALAWCFGVALWEIRSARKRQWRRRDVAGEEALAARPDDTGCTPEQLAIAADLAAALDQTLASLRPTDVETLLRYARDERPRGAGFRKRLQRARQRLQLAWSQRHG